MKSFKSFFPKTAFIALLLFSSGNFLFGQAFPVLSLATRMENKIKFAGSEGDMLIFEVQLDNLPVKGTTLIIVDDQSNTLFEERISTVTHICRYKISRNNMELITFKLSGKTFSFNQSFTINYRVEEKLDVKKI